MENGSAKTKGTIKRSPEQLFTKFVEAEDCAEILQTFQRLLNVVGVAAETPREFYQCLKTKLQSWKCKSLWELLDIRANQNEYLKGNVCEDIHALVIGCGPIGLRTAIELALLGAQVVVVEKRKRFSRNNVLHLWPFLLTDFRSLGAKKFYGKFCSGAIDHISIRRLQAVLLKSALVLGVKVFTGVTFEKVIEPISEDEGWKCHVTPFNDALSDFEVDVIIGADGKKNVLPGFAQIEMRGTLAIGITANFVNHFSEEEARAEEISGIAYQFNPAFFDRLKQQKGIKLENIVYYKDETHYFVMTAVKSSLLKRGVLKKEHKEPQKLLSQDNVDQEKLISYVNDAVSYATKGELNNPELKRDDKDKADIAVFDFTSIKKAENSARILERKGHKLLLGLVGDSLLEPFWPTGSGCARGVLSALDAAWMVRSFAQDKPPLQILSERENIYRLLSGTSNENMHKNHATYTINPSSRYTHIPQKKIQEVYHLYDTDDPVNADFSLGSPTGFLAAKGSKKKRVSTAIKPHYRHHRKHIRFASSPSFDSPMSSSCSSLEDLTTQGTRKRPKIDTVARQRTFSETLTSGGEEVHEITTTKGNKRSKRTKRVKSPTSALNKTAESGGKMKSKKHKTAVDRTVSSPASGAEKPHKRRSFFVFGRARAKSRVGKKSPRHVEKTKEVVEEQIRSTSQSQVETSNGDILSRDDSYQREMSKFSRNHPTRRSARDIIAEIEARNNNPSSKLTQRKNSAYDRSLKEITSNEAGILKRATSDSSIYTTPPIKQSKAEDLWKELASLSPCAKGAVPALSKLSPPEYQKENDLNAAHSGFHDISSAIGIAGLMAMATPLLASTYRQQGSDKNLPWHSRNAGRVKENINKYDSLTGRRLFTKDGTPLRPPNDRVDNADSKLTLAEVAQRIMDQQKSDNQGDERPSSWHATALAVVEGKADVRTISDQEMALAREQEMEKLRLLGKELSILDHESTDSPVKKNLSSAIYQKTFIADLNKADHVISSDTADLKDSPATKNLSSAINQKSPNADLNNGGAAVPKEGKPETPRKQLSIPRDYAMEGEWRKSPALAKKEMDRVLLNLTETISHERALTSIKFLISMYRRIQRNPKEDKFRRIFKSRVKFKKHVWTVRNAKMFLLASGWMEVGSFLLFPAEKNVREPLTILNKYLGLLENGSTVQISTIKSTPRREANNATTSTKTGIEETPRSTARKPSTTSTSSIETPLKDPEGTPAMDKRFSRSVPMNLNNNDWDLEMEDPLEQVSVTKSAKKPSVRRRLVSSALELRTPRTPATPDFAIMEEIDELSNTLDDLMETMDDVEKEKEKTVSEKRQSKEIKDLCTTIDYLLDSSEEEELDRDLNTLSAVKTKEVVTPVKTSAFTKVTTPSNKRRQLPSTTNTFKKPLDKDNSREARTNSVTRKDNSKKTDENKYRDSKSSEQSPVSKSENDKPKRIPSRRKLPEEPKTDRTSVNSLDRAQQSSQRNTSDKGKGRQFKRQISQESLSLIQRRFGSENDVSTAKTTGGIRKDRPFSLSKKRGQPSGNNTTESGPIEKPSVSNDEKSRSTRESDHKEKLLSKNNSQQRSCIKKSQSALDVTRHSETKFTKTDKQTIKKSAKDATVPSKSSRNDNSNNDSEPRQSSRASLSREGSTSGSISSIDSASLNARPPSGFERTRSARARRRKKISEKLECLETSYESLEHSPKKTSSRKGSTSSSTSSSSRTTSVTSEQRKTSQPKGNTVKRTSSNTSQSSVTSQDHHGDNKPDSLAMRTRSRSATAKRTPSIERKTLEDTKELQKKPSTQSSNSMKDISSKPPHSSAVDASHNSKTSLGNGRGSIRTKHRKLPSTKSATACNGQSSAKEQPSKVTIDMPNNVVDNNLNDSFDSITVSESLRLENDPHSYNNHDLVDNLDGPFVNSKNNAKTDTLQSQQDQQNQEDENLKVQLKLENTGSWMVLDYEGTNTPPGSTRSNSMADIDPGNLVLAKEILDEDLDTVDGNQRNNRYNNTTNDSAGVTSLKHNTDSVGQYRHDNNGISTDPVLQSSDDFNDYERTNAERIASNIPAEQLTEYSQSDKPQANGTVHKQETVEGGEIVRRNALRKKKTRKSEGTKPHATNGLSNGVKAVSFGEDQDTVKSSTRERPRKDIKNRPHLPFGLRRKKMTESNPDINGALEPTSPVIPNSSSSSLNKSGDKKKISPLKMLTKRRKLPDTRSLNNT